MGLGSGAIFSTFAVLKKKILKKFRNILVLLIFINFTALPGIAAIFDFDIPQTNVTISEEETHPAPLNILFEKMLPKPLDVHDFIAFFDTDTSKTQHRLLDDGIHLSPYLSIFSPPPEA